MTVEAYTRFIPSGVLFGLTLAFGIWLSRSGRPFNALLFNLHKLIALGAVVTAGLQVARLLKGQTPAAEIILLAAAAISVLALFITGALLSLKNPAPVFVLRIHQIAPFLLLGNLAASIFTWTQGKM